MGLLSFVKSAGAKLLGKSDEAAIKAEAQAQAQDKEMEAVRERLRRRRVEALLKQQLEKLGFTVEDLKLEYDGETVTIAGKVETQEVREKVLLVVGNSEGVGVVDDRLEVTKKEPEAVFYTVVKGDTLSKIAKQHYGNANKYPAIFEANRPMLEHPDKIYPGQVLRIPPQEG